MNVLALQEAIDILLDHTGRVEETEQVGLWDARQRVLSEDAVAGHSQPPFDRSPLDGYAVCSGDIAEASEENPVRLEVIDEICAGSVSDRRVVPGTAIRIMTGAPIPEGADCIVKQEDTDYGEDAVWIHRKGKHFGNYCFAGEDFRKGETVLRKDCLLNAVEIGVLASLGRKKVSVYRKPRAAVISTGDEVMCPGRELLPGKIYDSNLYTQVLQLESYGAEVVCREWAPDDAACVAERIRAMIDHVDLIVTTGGVSVGKKDIMHDVLKLLGAERLFWRIAIKPGMPTLAALYQGKLMICLSGNPFGATVNTELLVRPVMAKLTGRQDLIPRRTRAVILNAYPKRSPVTRYIRAFYQDNQVRMADGSNDSGILSTMSGCNCLVEVPAGTQAVQPGDEVTVVLM